MGITFAKRLAYNPDAEVKASLDTYCSTSRAFSSYGRLTNSQKKVDNKKLNLKRDQENKAGKYAKATGLVVVSETDRRITTSTGEQVSVPHPVSARMAQVLANRPSGSEPPLIAHRPDGPVPFNGISEYRGPGYDS